MLMGGWGSGAAGLPHARTSPSAELQESPSEEFLCVLILFPTVSICLGTGGEGAGVG